MLKFARGIVTPLAPRLRKLPAAIGARGDWERETSHAEKIFSSIKIGTHRPHLPAPRYAHHTIIVRPVYVQTVENMRSQMQSLCLFRDSIIFQKDLFAKWKN